MNVHHNNIFETNKGLLQALKDSGQTSLSIEDCVGLEIDENSKIKFWSERDDRGIYYVKEKDGILIDKKLDLGKTNDPRAADYISLKDLLNASF